jgi:rhodanese-related sulfurtransferase
MIRLFHNELETDMIKTRWRGFAADLVWQVPAIVLIAVILAISVNHFRPNGLPLIGNAARGPDRLRDGAGEQSTISLEEARALFLTNGAVFIDARPAELYRYGHIKGALNLPIDSFEEMSPAVFEQVPSDSYVIVYCDGEDCPLSHEVALQMAAKGYLNAHVLANGWTVWQDAGLPVQTTGKD